MRQRKQRSLVLVIHLLQHRRRDDRHRPIVEVACGDGIKDPQLVKQGGQAAKDALIACPCAPASGPFKNAYTKKWGQAPATYSTESYDLATIQLKGIDSGHTTRPALLDFVRNYKGQGVARKYQWDSTGELTTTLIWMYKVQ